jgi:hypothetical protein
MSASTRKQQRLSTVATPTTGMTKPPPLLVLGLPRDLLAYTLEFLLASDLKSSRVTSSFVKVLVDATFARVRRHDPVHAAKMLRPAYPQAAYKLLNDAGMRVSLLLEESDWS